MSFIAAGIGAAGSIVGGVLQNRKGNQQLKQAGQLKAQRDAAFNAIPLEDPRQVQVLEETRRRRRAFETGTAFSSELRNLRSAQAGTQQNILRAAGGAGGAAIAGLGRTQLATARGISDIGKASMQAQLSLTDRISAQTDLITKRKTQLQTARVAQLSAEAAQSEREGNANKNAATASFISAGTALAGGALSGITAAKTAKDATSAAAGATQSLNIGEAADIGGRLQGGLSGATGGLDIGTADLGAFGGTGSFRKSGISPTNTQFKTFDGNLFGEGN